MIAQLDDRAFVEAAFARLGDALRGVALHPYSLALDLGRKIRLAMPLATIAKGLRESVRTAMKALPEWKEAA